MEVKSIIREFVQRSLLLADENIIVEDDVDIFLVGYVNSLFSVTLLAFLEKKFKIEIDNSELDISNFNTINNITNFINKKLNE